MERNLKQGNIYSEGGFKEQEAGFRINLSMPFEYETTIGHSIFFNYYYFFYCSGFCHTLK